MLVVFQKQDLKSNKALDSEAFSIEFIIFKPLILTLINKKPPFYKHKTKKNSNFFIPLLKS